MEEKNVPLLNFSLAAGAFEGGLALVALFLGWIFDIPPMGTFSWSWLDLLWGILATLPILGLFALCLLIPWKPFRRIEMIMRRTILPLFRECSLLEIALIAILAGLGEELLFRPIIQGGLAQSFAAPYGTIAGLCLAAVIFAILHLMTPTYAFLAGLIGLYLGAVWLWTGNLLVPIIAHALYDFLAISIMLRLEGTALKRGSKKV
jgi:membrane protease YdiL (CAAX protease family)